MEKRTFERIPANLPVSFYCCNSYYLGTVMNISKNGMFISTKEMFFPFESNFEIIILKDKFLKIPVKVKMFTKSTTSYNGIGVEVISPSQEYLKLVDSLGSLKPLKTNRVSTPMHYKS